MKQEKEEVSWLEYIRGVGTNLIQEVKTVYTNSSLYKENQYSRVSFAGAHLSYDSQVQGIGVTGEDFFKDVCFSDCQFEGTALINIYQAENVQFVGCWFNNETNFIALAYHSQLGSEAIRQRLIDPHNQNTGGGQVILSIKDANRVLNEAFLNHNKTANRYQCVVKKDFLNGLISSVNKIRSTEVTLDGSEINEMERFYVTMQLIKEQVPDINLGEGPKYQLQQMNR